jgi:hypothetical protein
MKTQILFICDAFDLADAMSQQLRLESGEWEIVLCRNGRVFIDALVDLDNIPALQNLFVPYKPNIVGVWQIGAKSTGKNHFGEDIMVPCMSLVSGYALNTTEYAAMIAESESEHHTADPTYAPDFTVRQIHGFLGWPEIKFN